MNTKKTLHTALLCLSATLLASACSTSTPSTGSGFLPDYSQLKQESTADGGSRQVYVNPAFTPARYDAVWLDPVVFYPDPKPTDDVSMQTLTQIRNAIDQSLRSKIGQQVQLVDRAGPGVARMRVAITAVGAESEALKAYQYIPIALVLTGAKAALDGGRPREAAVAVETHVMDSQSGDLLYAAVRGGTGERISKADDGQGGVQLSQLRPLVDAWTTGASEDVRKYVRGK